jgi:FkbM family methyltransferase
MRETYPRPYEIPSIASEDIRICENVSVRPGVGFALVTGAEPDLLSQHITSGYFWYIFGPLIELLEATVPPGGRVLDLGSHVGAFTLSAAALGYEVVAVEASPRNASLLRASIKRNGFDRVRIVHAAVSDRPGTVEFCQAGPYGHVIAAGSSGANVTVQALAVDYLLDELGWDQVDFIKMDIEGSEIAGIKGLARRLRRADAPPLFVESNGHTLAMFGQTPTRLRAVLRRFGYHTYQEDAGRLFKMRPADLQPKTCVDYVALKGAAQRQAAARKFRIDPPLSQEEVIERLLVTCQSSDPVERGYAGRSLAAAPRAILSRKQVVEAIDSLRADESESVRRAAATIRMPSALRAWSERLLGALKLDAAS